ncbi:two-component system sensor histidine kinase NtrB [Halobellus captivus]|uniref:two-component system sensor histidine kinase NtrB n=1 Tax=Halobellus captivus TaxID=2592614 RepID=UPI0011A8A550|nr:PAS domain-containing sensor histidine kinase [Halobellus captivus]
MEPNALPVSPDTFYQTLVESAAEGMLTIDADSTIVYANPAIEDILGYTPEELIGSSKMKIIPERLRPVHGAALAAYVDTGVRNIDWAGVELPALHKDGHEVPTLISLREHTHGGEQYFTGIVRDISERRRREDELRDQKERLDEFADILAHDIRNPLSVARGYTELATQREESPELKQVLDALDRIDHLVDDVLALSRQGRFIGETEVVDLERSIRDSWRNVETGETTLHVEADLGSITADRSRLEELFENLFRNAIEHGAPDTETTERRGTVDVGRLADRNGFYVADDGPGIPDTIRESIFEHGYSTQADGTGYGLAIVKQIVDAHGWEVSVSDNEGAGARFEISGVESEP